MKKTTQYIALVLLLFSSVYGTNTAAQNIRQEVQKMQQLLTESEQFALHFEIKAYDQLDESTLQYSRKGTIKKQGDRSITEFNGVTSLKTRHQFVMVDHTSQQIIVDQYKEKDIQKVEQWMSQLSLDTTTMDMNQLEWVDQTGMTQHYLLKGWGSILEAHFYLHSETGMLQRAIYYYSPEQYPTANKIVMDYELVTSPQLSPQTFDPEQYLTVKNNHYSLTPTYSSYSLILNSDEN